MDIMPATGWGFANTGVVDTVLGFVNINPIAKRRISLKLSGLSRADKAMLPANRSIARVAGTSGEAGLP